MIFSNSLSVTLPLTFSDPLTTDDLVQMGDGMMDGMIEQARCLMDAHMAGEKLLPANSSVI